MELARHKELVNRFSYVRYLHAIRCYNTAADALATEKLDAKKKKLPLGEERYKELRKLNRIKEKLVGGDKPVEAREGMPAVSVITRSTTRRVRFADQLGDGPPTERSDESVEIKNMRRVVDIPLSDRIQRLEDHQVRKISIRQPYKSNGENGYRLHNMNR